MIRRDKFISFWFIYSFILTLNFKPVEETQQAFLFLVLDKYSALISNCLLPMSPRKGQCQALFGVFVVASVS